MLRIVLANFHVDDDTLGAIDADGDDPLQALIDAGRVSAADRDTIVRMLRHYERSVAMAAVPSHLTYHGGALFFRATVGSPADPEDRWARAIQGELVMHDIQTNHFRVLDAPFQAQIGHAITRALNQPRLPKNPAEAAAD